jgi:hypothetical protein
MLSVEKAKVIRGNRNLERRVMQVGERKNLAKTKTAIQTSSSI